MTRTEKIESTVSLSINGDWCKGCGICVAFCPREALFLDNAGKAEKDSVKCKACGVCVLFCPDFALSVTRGRISANAGS